MGSKRLPNKMLLFLHGYPICEWVFKRVQQAKTVDQIIFALPNSKDNDILAWYLESIGANVYRGSEIDLVDRYYKAAKLYKADSIIRVCGDNPMICGSEIDFLVDFFKQQQCDYAYNHIPKNNTYPDGLGAEICSIEILAEINSKAVTKAQREHLFKVLWDNEVNYDIKTFNPRKEISYPKLKLDIDTLEDYKRLLEKPYRIGMSANEIIETTRK